MTRTIVAVDLKVECADGSIRNGVKLAVENSLKIYLAQDGTVLENVKCVHECTVILPPMALAAILSNCSKEVK